MKLACGMKMFTFLSVVNQNTGTMNYWRAHQHADTYTNFKDCV